MKATLEFILPEEEEFHKWAVESAKMVSVITDLDNYCRSCLKHGHKHDSVEDALEEIRERLRETINMVYDL